MKAKEIVAGFRPSYFAHQKHGLINSLCQSRQQHCVQDFIGAGVCTSDMQESDKRQESRLGESVREAEDRRYSIPTRVALINSTTSQLGHQGKITRRGFLGLVPVALISATWTGQRPQSAGWLVQRPVQRPTPSKKLVWVVDDEPALGELYRLVLNGSGYLTRIFEDRAEALEALYKTDQTPALLITDFIGRPIGADLFMQRCRTQYPQIRILMVTGCDRSCLQDCVAKPDRFLEKPFRLESMLTEVGGLLGRPQ